jgi:hypothetical protein
MDGGSVTTSVRPRNPAVPAHRKPRSDFEGNAGLWIFVALLVVGFVIRILIYRSGWMGQDSDEANGELMAIRTAQGHLSIFYWGQNYGGAGLAWIEGLLIKIFGIHLILFWLVDTILATGCCWALRLVARRMLPPVAASVAAGAFFFFPPLWLYWSSREYLFWTPAILVSLLCANAVLSYLDRRRTVDVLLAGFLMGLAIWLYPVTVDLVAIPAVAIVVVLIKNRDYVKMAAGVVCAVVGVSPWLVYFVRHGSAAFATKYTDQSKFTALRGAMVNVMPTALAGGLRRAGLIWAGSARSHTELVLIAVAVFGGTGLLFLWFLFTRQWLLAATAATVLLWPIVLVFGHVLLVTSAERYGFIAVPALLIEGAWLFSRVRLSVGLAALLIAFSTYMSGHQTQWFAASPSCLPSLNGLATQLEAGGHTRVWAAYWISADLTFCSDDKVEAAATNVPRDMQAQAAAQAQTKPVYVVFSGNALDKQIGAYVAANQGVATRTVIEGFAVWYFNTQVEPAQMALNATT